MLETLEPVDLSPELAQKYWTIVQLASQMTSNERNAWFLELRRALHDLGPNAKADDYRALDALTISFEMAQLARFVGTSPRFWKFKPH